MNSQLHRYLKHEFRALDDSVIFSIIPFTGEEALNDYRNTLASSQIFDIIPLNDLERGNAEDQRSGTNIYQKELRVKLVVMSYDAYRRMAQNRFAFGAEIRGQQNEDFRSIRNYGLNTSNLRATIGSASFTGTVDGEVVNVIAGEINPAFATTPLQFDSTRVLLTDSHPNDPPGFYLEAGQTTFFNPLVTTSLATSNYIQEYNETYFMRIVILKYWDKIFYPKGHEDPSGVNLETFYRKTDCADVYGPLQEFPGDTFNLAGFVQFEAVSLTCPLNDGIWKFTDILYDKVVAFDANRTTFSIDEVWKLNESASWNSIETNLPKDNGILLLMYNYPTGAKWNNSGSAVNGYCVAPNIFYYSLDSELYYEQPF